MTQISSHLFTISDESTGDLLGIFRELVMKSVHEARETWHYYLATLDDEYGQSYFPVSVQSPVREDSKVAESVSLQFF